MIELGKISVSQGRLYVYSPSSLSSRVRAIGNHLLCAFSFLSRSKISFGSSIILTAFNTMLAKWIMHFNSTHSLNELILRVNPQIRVVLSCYPLGRTREQVNINARKTCTTSGLVVKLI